MTEALPIIDVGAFLEKRAGAAATARAIEKACREFGFFYATGHGVGSETAHALKEASARFFALPETSKMEIAIARGGRAWRGYFPVGGELTSGAPDLKEGLYFGEDLDASDPRVTAGWPLHGANLFPKDVPELAAAVRTFLAEAERAAHAIMAGIAVSLGLDADYFHSCYTSRPTLLFRIFHYPPSAADDARWGVGEHTDYGLLTLRAQDDAGGLQVKTAHGWLEAPPIPETLVCNIGDMLDRLTGGTIVRPRIACATRVAGNAIRSRSSLIRPLMRRSSRYPSVPVRPKTIARAVGTRPTCMRLAARMATIF